LGLKLWRAESLNDSPMLVKALVEVISGEYKATVDEITVPAGVYAVERACCRALASAFLRHSR